MSGISYFQKYSQKENHITNNTMLMLQHMYRYSPIRFEALLKGIYSDLSVELGLNFTQQVRGPHSVPDGYIYQNPLSIYIEAKADGTLSPEQIERHVKNAVQSDQSAASIAIIGLSKQPLKDALQQECEQICKAEGIYCRAITYGELLEILRENCPEYSVDLSDIIESYKDFLLEEKMLPNPYLLVAVPCGKSHEEIIKYNIYHEPATRPSLVNAPYCGLYTNKMITHIGKISSTCITVPKGDSFVFQEENGVISADNEQRIRTLVDQSGSYALDGGGYRYYFLSLQEVNIRKESPGGLQSKRYIDLQEIANGSLSSEDRFEELINKMKGGSFR